MLILRILPSWKCRYNSSVHLLLTQSMVTPSGECCFSSLNSTYVDSRKISSNHCKYVKCYKKNCGSLLSTKNEFFSNGMAIGLNPCVKLLSMQSVAQMQASVFAYLSESTPAKYAQTFFEYIHDITDLPWYGSIILTTIIVRALVALPLALHQNYIFAKVQNLRIEMIGISRELHNEVAFAREKFGWSKEQAAMQYRYSMKRQWDKLIVRDNCHPFKASLPIYFQLPLWIFLSISLRNMTYMLPHRTPAAESLFLQLSEGGCLWFPNLTDIDHTFILPVTLGFLNLAIVELQVITKFKKSTIFQNWLTNFFRVLSIVMIPIAANVPTSMSLYWVASSACGLAQNLLLVSPTLKRWTRFPKLEPFPKDYESSAAEEMRKQVQVQDHPYRHISSEIQSRFRSLSSKIGIGKG